MFAGPNGSGKTTLFRTLAKEHSKNGVFKGEPFVNADDMDAELRETGKLSLHRYGIAFEQEHMTGWLRAAAWSDDTARVAESVRLADGAIRVAKGTPFSYAAAMIAAFLRSRLVDAGRSFSFETVMSHPGKITLLRNAKVQGFRTCLYFVATDDVELNVRRVGVRVQVGGHPVPEEKIRERYRRSLALLPDAVRAADRAYLFDNSTESHILLAEAAGGKLATVHVADGAMPSWFRRCCAVLDPQPPAGISFQQGSCHDGSSR